MRVLDGFGVNGGLVEKIFQARVAEARGVPGDCPQVQLE